MDVRINEVTSLAARLSNLGNPALSTIITDVSATFTDLRDTRNFQQGKESAVDAAADALETARPRMRLPRRRAEGAGIALTINTPENGNEIAAKRRKRRKRRLWSCAEEVQWARPLGGYSNISDAPESPSFYALCAFSRRFPAPDSG